MVLLIPDTLDVSKNVFSCNFYLLLITEVIYDMLLLCGLFHYDQTVDAHWYYFLTDLYSNQSHQFTCF
jgi:hypothetical protein